MSTGYGIAKKRPMMLGGLLVVAAAVLITATPAAAHGGGHVFFGFGAPAYYPSPYYYPPSYYYPPPVYAPVPVYGTVQPVPPPPSPAAQDGSGQTCREYQTTIQVDGQWQPAYGTACLQPDGTWRTVK